MMNPWIQNYLVLSLAGIRFAEQACRIWQDMLDAPVGDLSNAVGEPWLVTVDADRAVRARRPVVGNSAAAVYSRWGLDLSRLQVANSPCRGRHNRCS